jgi:hypothetical protein
MVHGKDCSVGITWVSDFPSQLIFKPATPEASQIIGFQKASGFVCCASECNDSVSLVG